MFTRTVSTGARTEVAPHPTRESVELIISHLDRLPALPAVAVRLIALTTSDKSSVRDVVEVLEADASLTAAVLRMVRRADLGVPADVVTVERAIALLGFNAIRNLVLSIRLYETLGSSGGGDEAGSIRPELWKHNLAVACAAEMIAARSAHPELGTYAFVGGLLHDLGKIALDACLPKAYTRVVETVQRHRRCICDVERDLLGLDHTVAGKHLAMRWLLPAPIVESVWLHHQEPDALPSFVVHRDLVKLIHIADDLVRRQRIGFSGYQHVGDIEGAAATMGVDRAAVEAVAAGLPARMEPFCELVGLDESTSRTLYAESLVKANHELGRLNEKLAESSRALERRSAFFDALTAFTGRLTEHDQVGDLCVAAAESIRQLAGAEQALAFVADAAGRQVRSGGAFGAGTEPATSLVELSESQAQALRESVPDHGRARGFVAAAAACEPIWQRCVGSSPHKPLWFLPFVHAEGGAGGVLVAAEEEKVVRLQSAVEESRALATAIGLAASSALARVRRERANEELLDLNRRHRAAQRDLVRARSVAMIGEMAAGAAHELNNPLAVISGRAQMAQQNCADPELARTLATIVEHARTAAQIVTDLMHFAKPEPPKPVEQRLAAVVESLCQRWRERSSLPADRITTRLAAEALTVHADAGQLQTVLDAVMANAVEACRRETVRLQINSPSRVSDETVRIVIEDNGVGMTPDVAERAFDPFFSSRPAGRGRGLGLSRAYRLTEINGGHLWLESRPNEGTIVTIELPARAARL